MGRAPVPARPPLSRSIEPGLVAGLWTLTERIGRGGMAEVWRASADDSPDVAIKLMPNARALDAAFEAEVAALARLVHPRIIRILDFGTMTVVDGALPFLALELAHGPSLDRWFAETPIGWTDVLDVSRRVLEALAHAHSRGLVHRDIKPANVLAMDAGASDWRLTDFGIAQADDTATDQSNPSGTPPYMAPEQFTGRSINQGPWTDLYSFGCVLHELLTGTPPFEGPGFVQLAFAHMREPAPALEPRFDVPAGLDELLGVLLRKDPMARFRSAADVLRALEKLPQLRRSQATVALGRGFGADTYVTPAFEPTVLLGDLDGFEWRPESEDDAPFVEPSPPAVEPPETSPRHYFSTFHGDTGPGLTGLRELPFVGRLDERTALWDAFRDAVAARERRTVIVRGPQGIGKSAIGRWLTQAVTEHGLAVAIRVTGAQDVERALLNALAATYRLDPGAEAQTAERLRRWAEPPDWAIWTLARGISSSAGPDEDVVGAALAMLWAHAERKPVVIWVDDADNPAFRKLVERMATLPFAAVPILVVAATRGEGRELSEVADVEVVMGAFAPGECAELITELIGIAPEEAYLIAKAVDGNPRFAVEVMHDWIARGLLVRSAGRWMLRGGRLPDLPPSIGAVRFQQLETLAAAAEDRDALELLACYGPECPHGDWVRACEAANVTPTSGLIVHAMRAGLVEQQNEVLRFADGVLRRQLMATAKERGRSEALHRAIASVILEQGSSYPAALIGVHLFEAGDFQAALEPLREAANRCERGDQDELAEILRRYDVAVAAVGAEDTELGWWGRFTRARLLSNQWKGNAAAVELREVIAAARERGWSELECDATIAYVNLVSARAPQRSDGELAARGVKLADSLGEGLRRAQTRSAAGAMFGYLGQVDEALRHYVDARQIAVELDNVSEQADADYGIGWAYFLQGKLDRALVPLQRAIEAMESIGRIRGAYAVRSFTGDVLRALGRLDEAEAAFTDAYHYFSRYHVLEAVMPANFAMLEVARGRLDDALRWARRARQIESPRGRIPILAVADAVELLLAARDADEVAWDEAFGTLRKVLAGHDASYDIAYVTDVAARETAGSLDRERTEAVVQLAIEFWTRLGRESEADALRILL